MIVVYEVVKKLSVVLAVEGIIDHVVTVAGRIDVTTVVYRKMLVVPAPDGDVTVADLVVVVDRLEVEIEVSVVATILLVIVVEFSVNDRIVWIVLRSVVDTDLVISVTSVVVTKLISLRTAVRSTVVVFRAVVVPEDFGCSDTVFVEEVVVAVVKVRVIEERAVRVS